MTMTPEQKALVERAMGTMKAVRCVDSSKTICDDAALSEDELAAFARAIIPLIWNDAAAAERERWLAELGKATDYELSDIEAEDALTSEGIFVWGPDGERFERMFAVVMKRREAAIRALPSMEADDGRA